jgi:hypothetical protein
MLFDQESPEETVSRFDTGEDPNHPLPSTNLYVQALLHVGRAQPPAVFLGEHHHTHGVLEAFLETGTALGAILSKRVTKAARCRRASARSGA